ncbi:MAG: hypothetical protein DI498_11030 [Paracoccus denitrificans]|nr:MAG: hypothetical protein DI498_11030 [Paracoccus denitrificans]PZO83672.1 MAG: hypothetical protein DI633_11030 [Paracoccus denitrificans]
MFTTPEAQSDPYVWAAALAGHWAIGAGLTALLMALPFRAFFCAALVSAIYGVLWEGGQLVGGGGIWDGLLDWSAVSLGAVTAAALWQRKAAIAAGAVGITTLLLRVGLRRRRR